MSDLAGSKLAELFTKISKAIDSGERNNLQKQVYEIMGSVHFLGAVEVVLMGSYPIDIKRALAGRLLEYTQKDFNNSSDVPHSLRENTIGKILQWISTQNLDIETRETIADAIIPIFKKISSKASKKEEEIRNKFYFKIFETNISQLNEHQIIGLLIGLSTFAKTHGSIVSIQKFFKEFTNPLVNLLKELLQKCGKVILEVEKNDNLDSMEVMLSSFILKYISTTFKYYVENLFDNVCYTYMNRLSSNANYVECFQGILLISTKGTGNIFSLTNKEEIDDNINQAKNCIISVFQKFSKYILEKTKNTEEAMKTLVMVKIKENCQILIDQLYKLCLEETVTVDNLREREVLRDLIVKILRHLNLLGNSLFFLQIFSKVHKEIFINIILPFILPYEDEKADMLDNAREFCEYAVDLSYRQNTRTIKAASMKLLDTICDRVDGASTFVILTMIYLIDYALSKTDIQTVKDYDRIKYLDGSKFIKMSKNNKEDLIDTGLLVLSSLSYQISLRDDLFMKLKDLFQNYFNNLTIASTPLVKSRFLLCLGYYFEPLSTVKNYKEMISNYIKFVCKSIKITDKNPECVSNMAVLTLKMIFKSENSDGLIEKMQSEIVKNIIETIPEVGTHEFFDILRYLFMGEYAKTITEEPDLVRYCLRVLIERSVKEIEDPTDIYHPDIFLIGIWNCLRAFSSSPVFIPRHVQIFDEEMRTILKVVDGKKKLLFDDDLVLSLNYILKQTKTIPPNMGLLINIFPEFNETYDKRVTMMQETYNILLDQIPQFFDDRRRIDDLLTIAINGVNCSTDYLDDVYCSEAIILIQLAIIYIPDKLTKEHWTTIFNHALTEMNQNTKENHVLSKIYNIFMVAFIFKPAVPLSYLTKHGKLDQVINMIIKRSAYYESAFDRKILILGLTSILKEKIQAGVFDQLAKTCFEGAAYNLKIQHYEELKRRKQGNLKGLSDYENSLISDYQKLKENLNTLAGLPAITQTFNIHKQNLGNFHDDDSDMEEDSSEDEPEDEEGMKIQYDVQEANDIMDFMYSQKSHSTLSLNGVFTKIDKEDEFKIFNQTMKKAKETIGKKAVMDHLATLQDLQRRVILCVLQSKRVDISKKKNGSYTVARKIIKVKSKKKPPAN